MRNRCLGSLDGIPDRGIVKRVQFLLRTAPSLECLEIFEQSRGSRNASDGLRW
jgi:hypothetical protein